LFTVATQLLWQLRNGFSELQWLDPVSSGFKSFITAVKMTTIEEGVGPTLEQKRAFSQLREGAHIPGYV